jgi:hypothetical protein
MEMEFKRAMAPEEVGSCQPCGVCGVEFVREVVMVSVLSVDLGVVCPSCIAYLGRRNPERLPTIKEYEEANWRHKEPIYDSEEEIMTLEVADNPSVYQTYRASWMPRAKA